MYVERCIQIDGQWVWHGDNCPHTWDEDELGPIKPEGWTVQQ